MKQIDVSIIVVIVICIFITFLVTVYFVNTDKEREINNLNEQIENLTIQLLQYVGDEDMFVGIWNRSLGDEHRYYDTMYLYSNKSARVEYKGSGSLGAIYSINNDKLVFEQHGRVFRDFIYSFHNDHTLVVIEPGVDYGPAIYIKET